MAKKFIINDGKLILHPNIGFHIEIAARCQNPKATIGGGWFEIIDEKLYLFGSSTEFGQCKKEEIEGALKTLPASYNKYDVYYSPQFQFEAWKNSSVKIRDKNATK